MLQARHETWTKGRHISSRAVVTSLSGQAPGRCLCLERRPVYISSPFSIMFSDTQASRSVFTVRCDICILLTKANSPLRI